MSAETLGPWLESSALGVAIRGPEGFLSFRENGVLGKDGERNIEARWVDVVGLEISLPTDPMWRWYMLAPLFLLVPAAVIRVPDIQVTLRTRNSTHHLYLGRPKAAPYPRYLAAGTDSLLETLTAQGQLRILGDIQKSRRLFRCIEGLGGVPRLKRRQTLLRLLEGLE